MLKAPSFIKRQNGFSAVEILLAATVLALLVSGLMGAIVFGRGSTAGAGDRTRANMLAEEGLEATRNIRDNAFSNLTDGTFGLVQSGGVWTFSGSSDVTGIFTRAVTISTVDAKRKNVSVTVTWNQGGVSTGSVTAAGELTAWGAIIPPTKTWNNCTLAGSVDLTGTTNGYKVATAGNYAYVIRNTSGSNNFFVVDVSVAASPTLVSSTTLAGTPTNVAVFGTTAYVTNTQDTGELQLVNVTVPSAPVLISTFSAPGNGDGLAVAVSGNFAYVSRKANGSNDELTIVNISVPATPTLAGGFSQNIIMNDVKISGNFAYVASGSDTQEIMVLNVSNPASVTLAGSFNNSGTADGQSIVLDGNTAYLAAGTALTSVNITTPASPTQIGTLSLPGGNLNSIDIDPVGKFLFIGSILSSAEFRVADVSNPASMTIICTDKVTTVGADDIEGLVYSSALDEVIAAAATDAQEVLIYTKN